MQLDTLHDDLKPYEPRFEAIIREGLALFYQRYGKTRWTMSVHAERMNIHDCLVEVAKKYFPDAYRMEGNLFLLAIEHYRIRIKKLDTSMRSSSYPTSAVFDFMSQKAELATGVLFPDLATVSLVLGYVPDAIDITKSEPWLTKPHGVGVRPEWQCFLRADEASASALIMPATSPHTPDDAKSRVTPKSDKKPSKVRNIGDYKR